MAEAGPEGRALGFARVRWVAPRPFLIGNVPLDIVHFYVVVRLLNVSCRSAVLVLKWIVFRPVHLVPSAQVLFSVKVFHEAGSLAQATHGDTSDQIADPDDCSEGSPDFHRRPLLIGDR